MLAQAACIHIMMSHHLIGAAEAAWSLAAAFVEQPAALAPCPAGTHAGSSPLQPKLQLSLEEMDRWSEWHLVSLEAMRLLEPALAVLGQGPPSGVRSQLGCLSWQQTCFHHLVAPPWLSCGASQPPLWDMGALMQGCSRGSHRCLCFCGGALHPASWLVACAQDAT